MKTEETICKSNSLFRIFNNIIYYRIYSLRGCDWGMLFKKIAHVENIFFMFYLFLTDHFSHETCPATFLIEYNCKNESEKKGKYYNLLAET